ncbi:cytochrome c oxidase assembly protein [Planoprotostelium fungivorum]|uniref:Cytochrome c oxidase assembly protein n=1 Tax=Planoprotostelium fungivorum TaxID=1890364 RepID=A0A2P6NKW8_9EUKA|nr:cytochrome c oxidase assembly protein [Planoprotostelium fungivorum]
MPRSKSVFSQNFVRTGGPAIAIIVGSSFLLATFLQGRNEYRDRSESGPTAENEVFKTKKSTRVQKEFDLEEEYKKTMQKLDIENWKNVRVQRPPGVDDE